MRTTKPQKQIDEKLVKELKELSLELRRLKSLEFVKVLKKPGRFFAYSFIHGLLVGFGSVLGATLVVAIFIYLLTQISFVPIIGGFVENILEEINPSSAPQSILEEPQEQTLPLNLNPQTDDSFKTSVSAVVPECEDPKINQQPIIQNIQ
jgi:hypothetical protein